MTQPATILVAPEGLLHDLRTLITQSRDHAAAALNGALVTLYWEVGSRIQVHLLQDGRADYGQQVIGQVANALSLEHGRSFSARNLYYMVRFGEVFPDPEIVNALRSQLTWHASPVSSTF